MCIKLEITWEPSTQTKAASAATNGTPSIAQTKWAGDGYICASIATFSASIIDSKAKAELLHLTVKGAELQAHGRKDGHQSVGGVVDWIQLDNQEIKAQHTMSHMCSATNARITCVTPSVT